MENPQAQMPQGQPGMEQGQAPQQGGQDQQMQQLMQAVQQMIQQGAQPTDVAAELLNQQVPPEVIMQVFAEMGLPEQEAQMAIQQAMQGGQQQQGPGEEQMEGAASNPDEEAQEGQGASPEMLEQMQNQPMAFGGQPRRLRRYENGAAVDPNQELQSVMEQVQGMMEQGADARQVMEQIQAAAQQGQISPEVATQVLEQLSGMQQAQNPQGSDATMAQQSQDPQAMDPNMSSPDAAMGMSRFGGMLKRELKKAYGGPIVPPGIDSKDYAKDRTSMFVNSVKNNAFKSTLDDEFPSLSGNQMAYGGIPKADKGYDVTSYKTADEAELAARRYYDNLDEAGKKTFDWKAESGKWKAPEPTYESGKNYQYDPATKQFKVAETPKNQFQYQEGDIVNYDNQGAYVTRKDGTMQRVPGSQNQRPGYNQTYSSINPVQYETPMGNTLYNNLFMSASPAARMFSSIGMNRNYDPRITGENLPGGMSGAQFLGNTGGLNGLTTGMTGTIGDQTWRVTGAEKFKEGSIWKGNRRKGVRYNIDWGSAGAMNPAGPQNNPAVTTNSNPSTTSNTTTNTQGSLSTKTPTGGSGMGAMERMNEDPLTGLPVVDNSSQSNNVSNNTATANKQLQNTTGGSGMGAMERMNEDVLNQPTVNQSVNNTPVQTRTGGSGMSFMEQDETEFPSLNQNTNSTQTTTNPVVTNNNPTNNPVATNNAVVNNGFGPNWQLPGQTPEEAQAAMDEINAMATQTNAANNTVVNNSVVNKQPPKKTVLSPQAKPVVNKPVVNNSNQQLLKGQPSNYYQKYADNLLDNGSIPWGTPQEKEYWNAVDMRDKAEKNEKWKKKSDYANTLFAPDNGDPTHSNWTEADEAAWRAGKAGASHEENKKAYLASKEGKKWIASLKPKSYGGNIDPEALGNAIALINRAFGGMIPMADNGMDLGSEDTDANNIPDYLQAENLPANQPNPFTNKGQLETSAGKKINVDWGKFGNAASDFYMENAPKVTKFMEGVQSYRSNLERDQAKNSALNRSSNTYDTMQRGIYDQQGNFIPNDIGNQVLNPSSKGYYETNQSPVIYALGGNAISFNGRRYDMGGDVELDDNELAALSAAGFKLSRV